VDDVVVKTRNSDTVITDLEETFASLQEYQWKINPNKCVFGVPLGKLLGFIISHRSIEANPKKISTITNMKAPTCIKDVQKLTGCMAALTDSSQGLENGGSPSSNYLSTKRSSCGPKRPIKLWRSSKTFSKPLVLTTPREKEQLLLYLTATTHVVSTAIVVERQEDGHAYPVQRPVYFISEVLSESKARYQLVQKLLYAMLITS
jgi:hypothetical protein